MSLFLLIDTAGPEAHLAIATENTLLSEVVNDKQKEHASFLQPAVQSLLKAQQLSWQDLSAVSVSNGPGSYTGLRVGLASAKGICFAQQLPLICLSTLDIMAEQAISASANKLETEEELLFAPMIDARRMEVYTAVYNRERSRLIEPQALILDETSYLTVLEKNKIIFSGDGSPKWKAVCNHPNAVFQEYSTGFSLAMARLTGIFFDKNQLSDVAYSEPYYIKNFHDTSSAIR